MDPYFNMINLIHRDGTASTRLRLAVSAARQWSYVRGASFGDYVSYAKVLKIIKTILYLIKVSHVLISVP